MSLHIYIIAPWIMLSVCVCMCTRANMFYLIEAPSWHIGQIDQLVCQLSWQSPSVSLFLKPSPLSHFLFNVYTLAIKSERRKSLVMIGVVSLTSILFFGSAVGCILEILTFSHRQVSAGPFGLTWPSLASAAGVPWSHAVENDGQCAKPAPFVIWAAHIVLIVHPIIRHTFPRWAG